VTGTDVAQWAIGGVFTGLGGSAFGGRASSAISDFMSE
jgi:hypothetical protein